jgi:hypothetical protein
MLQFEFGKFVVMIPFLLVVLEMNNTLTMIRFFEYRDEGLTPEIPSDCPQKLVELMKMCWKKEPEQRPVSSLSCSIFSLSNHFSNKFLMIFLNSLSTGF